MNGGFSTYLSFSKKGDMVLSFLKHFYEGFFDIRNSFVLFF